MYIVESIFSHSNQNHASDFHLTHLLSYKRKNFSSFLQGEEHTRNLPCTGWLKLRMKVEEVDVKVVLGRSNQMSKQNLLCWNKLCNCLRIDPQVSSEKIERGNLEFGGVKHQEAAHSFHYYWSLQAHHQQISCMCAVEHPNARSTKNHFKTHKINK